ncbi:MAG TPA: NAD(P)-binding domain-containing protein, partial [Steroidobacteraceae bacterium]
MRYGFIGLGHLGKHLAVNLARAGFDLQVHDLDSSSADAVLGAGARWSPSVRELAAQCDCLITCLPSPAATRAVLGEALPVLHPGSTWIEMSTNDFAEVEALAKRAEGSGVATLACPVTGGVHRAEAGDITVLVGGAQQVFDAHKAALEAMGGQ